MAIGSKGRRFWVRLLLGVVLACGTAGRAPAAEFVEFYKNGLAAAQSQRWSLAAEMMRKAIDGQPQERTKVKKALYFRRYLPHFHLGKALYEMGDCSGALTAWQESEAQGVVQRFPEHQQILDGRLACGQMTDLANALDKALLAVESAETSATRSRRRLSELPNADDEAQVLLDRQTEAEASLGRVRRRLASADIVLGEVEEAAAVAAVAAREFEVLRQQADEMRAARVAVRQEQLSSEIENLTSRARDALRSSEYLRPYPARVARSRTAVEQALQHAKAATEGSLSAGELQAVQSELAQATRDLRRTVSPPPAELEQAATAYLTRDYAGVLTILGESEFPSNRATSHSHLLQAAALFALYYSTGAGDEALLEQARQEVLACHDADQGQSPPTAVFSPSFVAFFERQTLEPVASGQQEGVDEGL